MLQGTLKQATQHDHEELEQLMYVGQIMKGTLTAEQYKETLLTNYLVHKIYEKQLQSDLSINIAQLIDLYDREKLAALEADLKELQAEVPAIEIRPVKFDSDAEILGALYVLEGATLGGSVIAKQLKTNPNFADADLGFHYYQVYGAELIPKWKRFCEVLDQQPDNTFADSVEGAHKMFKIIADTQRKASAK